MKSLKIIHLSNGNNFVPSKGVFPGSDLYFINTWAGLIATRLKGFNSNLDIETWRVANIYDTKVSKNIYNILCIIWPNKIPIFRNLLTLDMIKQLNEYTYTHTVVLHYHDLFNLRFVVLIGLLCPKVRVVLSHHGGIPPDSGTLKGKLMKLFYRKHNISLITYLSPSAKIFLEGITNHPPLAFLPVGADFDQFYPMNKLELRMELGLDPKKTYGIYVGKFYKLKSVNLIIEAYNELKYKYNFQVIFVGGNNSPDNDLYNEVVASGCPYFGSIAWINMVKYYNAADFYIHPAFNPAFGGLDVSWIEALACNKPILSPQLEYLDFDYSDLGVLIKDKSDLISGTEWMIKNHFSFLRCREISEKHLDGKNIIMEKLVKAYENI